MKLTFDSFVYQVFTQNALPGKNQFYHGILKCRAWNSKETYELEIPVELHIPADGPGSHSWQQALERCEKIIEYLPKSNQSKMRQIVDERSIVLGAEGLDELRRRIWKTGIKLWEGEGGKGYEDEAEWAQRCESYFSFIEVSCDIALDILEKYSGTTLAGYIKPVKDALKSFIIAYSGGKDLDEWLIDHYLVDVIKLYESIEKSLAESELDDKFRDYVVDFSSGILKSKEVKEEIETYFKKNYKAKIIIGAIQFYICLIEGFTKDYKNGDSVVDVFLKAIEKFGKEQLSDFVGGKLYKKFGTKLKDKSSKYVNKGLKNLDNGNNPVNVVRKLKTSRSFVVLAEVNFKRNKRRYLRNC